MLPTDVALL
jgi:catalase (peroxidase I)